MKARQKLVKRARTTAKRDTRAQHERSPMLGVRIPKALYTQLQQAAKQDQRTLADWLRLNLPRLLVTRIIPTWANSHDDSNPFHLGVQEPTEPADAK